ncbi:hypothetical protein MASR2M78_27690 [Treponema sp.]
MRIYRRFSPVLFVSAALLVLASCVSTPPIIPEGLSPAELVQKAQNASDRNKYENAIAYYQAILDRYPQDLSASVGAEYEIAFIRYKQKKYDDSKLRFRNLLSRYEGTDAALLPAQYKILSEKVLGKMELEKK